MRVKRHHSRPVDLISTRVICGEKVTSEIFDSKQGYLTTLRQVVVGDAGGERITSLIDNTQLAPRVVGELYRLR